MSTGEPAGCPEVRRILLDPEAIPDPRALEHLLACPSCAEQLHGPLPDEPDPSELAREVLAKLAEPQPLPARIAASLSTRARLALVAVAAIAPSAAAAVRQPRATDFLDHAPALGLLLGASLLVAGVSLTPIHRGAARGAGVRVSLALAVPLLLGLSPAVVPSSAGPTAACFATGAIAAAFVLAVLGLTERRRRPSAQWLLGAAALAGTAATAALELACGMPGLLHRTVGHGAAGLAWGAVLVLSLRILRTPRRASRPQPP